MKKKHAKFGSMKLFLKWYFASLYFQIDHLKKMQWHTPFDGPVGHSDDQIMLDLILPSLLTIVKKNQ